MLILQMRKPRHGDVKKSSKAKTKELIQGPQEYVLEMSSLHRNAQTEIPKSVFRRNMPFNRTPS